MVYITAASRKFGRWKYQYCRMGFMTSGIALNGAERKRGPAGAPLATVGD
jgi:hypothetical protein